MSEEPCKVYVGNLNFNTEAKELEDVFGAFGKIESASVVTDKESGRSRGFGFVLFEDAHEAQKAITELDNTELAGRCIKVSKALSKPEGGRGGFGGRSDGRFRGGGGRGRAGYGGSRGNYSSRGRGSYGGGSYGGGRSYGGSRDYGGGDSHGQSYGGGGYGGDSYYGGGSGYQNRDW